MDNNLITDIVPVEKEAPTDTAEAESEAASAEAEPSEPTEEIYAVTGDEKAVTVNPMLERIKLTVLLICTLLATVGVIVWGSIITERMGRGNFPYRNTMLERFFGTGVASIDGSDVSRPLNKIPSSPVEEGSEAGASEDETVKEEEKDDGEAVMLPVKRVDLSVGSDNEFALINETPYEPDVIMLYAEDMKTRTLKETEEQYGKGAPQVIILHTHGTESYHEDETDSYMSDDPFRTYDTEKNVVAVGRVIAAKLREYGIGVIHIETMFDGESYNEAYVKSNLEVRRLLELYPSVEYVFDVHRDAMFTREGVNLAPTSPLESGGNAVAQIMLVVGTDHAGAPHGEWEDNLSFALKVQKSTLGVNGGIMRSLNLRSASFNAQYAKGALLVEIGAAGNTLEEAKRAGEIFASGVAKVLTGD